MRRPTPLTIRTKALLIAGGVIVVDHFTKWLAIIGLDDGPIVLIDDFLALRLVSNPGAAFGMLQGAGSFLALTAIAAVVFILLVMRKVDRTPEAVSLGLVLGGAAGNLLDRVFRGDGLLGGEVVDFVDFDFFPAFNVADSAITIGAILAVLLAFRPESE